MTLTGTGGRTPRPVNALFGRARALRSLRPARRRTGAEDVPTTQDALLRALCHDMRSPLACLEAALGSLDRLPEQREELLELAQAQTAHLASLLRTATATGGTPGRRTAGGRCLRDVVTASIAAAGLPAAQLSVRLHGDAGDVAVGDARVQRILVNLLENAHRHGDGAAVRLGVTCTGGWVELALRQAGVRATRVAPYLHTAAPPAHLTGLGLWSVQRQAGELGGRVVCEDDGSALTLRVQLPDH
jgi:signal transduction histidine kinase